MNKPDRLRDFEWHDLPVDEIAICSGKLVVSVSPYVEEAGEYRTCDLVLEEPDELIVAIAGTLAARDLKNIEVASLSLSHVDADLLSGAITFLPGSAGVWTLQFRNARWALVDTAMSGCSRAGGADLTYTTPTVWLFNGSNSPFASAVFPSSEAAESWIRLHGLSGTLTEYPVGVAAYDWAVEAGHFRPTKATHKTARFIGSFTSGAQRHFHYEDGSRD